MPNYGMMQLQKSTRSTGNTCYCYICQTARVTSHLKAVVGQGSTRQFNTVINNSNGLYGNNNVVSIPHTDFKDSDTNSDSVTRCKIYV